MKIVKGFSLIEVMVVVGIVGILAAIALPSYSEYTRRAKITEATSQLADLRVRVEQYFMDNRTYQGTGTACGVTMPTTTTKYFTLTCSAPTSSTYTITATGFGDMVGFAYTINDQNVRATTSLPTGWITKTNCWVLKKGGMC